MDINSFNGITSYHDGDVVSDYTNLIPLGKSIIDRVGEDMLFRQTVPARGSFVDSLGNIYVVYGQDIYRYTYDGVNIVNHGKLPMRVGNEVHKFDKGFLNTSGKVTFAESSVKPTTVYVCDGQYIYQWNTFDCADYIKEVCPWMAPYVMRMMPSPGLMPTSYSDDRHHRTICDDVDQYSLLTNPVDPAHEFFKTNDLAHITSISWFDNKLVATQQEKNTAWLTSTDPQQYWRYENGKRYLDAHVGIGGLVPANSQWYFDPNGVIDSNLWYNWYSSTNTADRLNQAVGFQGQLWLLNESTIEVWSRTGNEDAPLAPNSMSTIYHGGRSPLIVADVMYLVCRDRIGQEFIGAISNGQFKMMSNNEIDRRIGNRIEDLVPMLIREDTFVMVRIKDKPWEAYAVNKAGLWWRWYNTQFCEYAVCSLVNTLALSNKGSILRMNQHKRTLCDGSPILRYVRDWFQFFPKRTLIRAIQPTMDTGIAFSDVDDPQQRAIYCRISTDRGHTFGPYRYRYFGKAGDNDRDICWRGLGSGNSLLIEIGTTADYAVQIFRLMIDLA